MGTLAHEPVWFDLPVGGSSVYARLIWRDMVNGSSEPGGLGASAGGKAQFMRQTLERAAKLDRPVTPTQSVALDRCAVCQIGRAHV